MGIKTIIGAAAIAAMAYPGTRLGAVSVACQATPGAMIGSAEAMIPVSPAFWTRVNGIAAGDFGPPPTSPPFLKVWLMEKDLAARMASFLSAGEATTFARVCPTAAAPATSS